MYAGNVTEVLLRMQVGCFCSGCISSARQHTVSPPRQPATGLCLRNGHWVYSKGTAENDASATTASQAICKATTAGTKLTHQASIAQFVFSSES